MTSDKHWFAAYVKSCKEKITSERLCLLGIENYLPVWNEIHQWSDRKKVVGRLVIPGMIFVHCTEADRLRSLKESPYLYKYITEKGPFTASVIPDKQMDVFRRMVDYGKGKVEMSAEVLSPGDHVRVVSGPLEGVECELVRIGDKRRCLAVRLHGVGTAMMDLDMEILKKIDL